MDYRACPNLVRMLFDQAERLGDKPCLWTKRDGAWRAVSYRDVGAQTSQLARTLRALGVQPGDRVGLVAENRPEWVIADFAIMAAGGVCVPAYVTNTIEDHRYVLANTGCKGVIASTQALAEKALLAARQVQGCGFMIAIEPPRGAGGTMVVQSWYDALARGLREADGIEAAVAGLGRGDLACIIHTSGTGVQPKGETLHHGAILTNCLGAYHLLEQLGLGDEVFLSFLPLSHSYEHSAGECFPLSIGAQIYFAESVEALSSNLVEVRPTIMTAVPRLYETLHRRIVSGVERQGGLKAALFHKGLAVGRKRYEAPSSLSLLERLVDPLLDRLVRDKVRARFGGRLKALVSGGAPLNYEIGLFFTALGLTLLQGYGQTEAAPVVSANPPGRVKLDTVGPPLVDVQVKVAEDGEILVHGELVMQGYWNDPEATQATVRDGWLHTGDVGLIDGDGYIKITDRKKDFIKNSGGNMIAPARVEGLLALQPEILQAMVHGDLRPHLVAVIVPHPDMAKAWTQAHGEAGNPSGLADDKAFRAAIEKAVERVNAQLSAAERIRRFVVAREPFTIANEMMTPTLKIRRHKVREAYGAALEKLYQ
ncbi:MAG TPA: long-chain fatty acid--CoA ligase [Alphaproteobacteria bacterium]|nr:long-chain fatty acid--CoA ligase [Alphaproteobacteria bacterium]